MKHKRCKECYENNFIEDYQKIQSEKFYDNCDYVLSFISEPGTSAKFIRCYKVSQGIQKINSNLMPKGFPSSK